LDVKVGTILLSILEREELKLANEKINKLRSGEEINWIERAKVKYVKEEGNNTKYFILITNGKHREKIFQLEHDEGTIVGDETLKCFLMSTIKSFLVPLIKTTSP
jgi:hypothetical protein